MAAAAAAAGAGDSMLSPGLQQQQQLLLLQQQQQQQQQLLQQRAAAGVRPRGPAAGGQQQQQQQQQQGRGAAGTGAAAAAGVGQKKPGGGVVAGPANGTAAAAAAAPEPAKQPSEIELVQRNLKKMEMEIALIKVREHFLCLRVDSPLVGEQGRILMWTVVQEGRAPGRQGPGVNQARQRAALLAAAAAGQEEGRAAPHAANAAVWDMWMSLEAAAFSGCCFAGKGVKQAQAAAMADAHVNAEAANAARQASDQRSVLVQNVHFAANEQIVAAHFGWVSVELCRQ
eukprot:1138229-Pelagomonas_calceolata.AAC.4